MSNLMLQDDFYTQINNTYNFDNVSEYDMKNQQLPIQHNFPTGIIENLENKQVAVQFEQKSPQNSSSSQGVKNFPPQPYEIIRSQENENIKQSQTKKWIYKLYVNKFIKSFRTKYSLYQRLKPYHYSVISDQSTPEGLRKLESKDYKYFNDQEQQNQKFQKILQILQKCFKYLSEGTIIKKILQNVPIIAQESQTKLIWDFFMTILRVTLILFASLEIAFNNKLVFDILIIPYFFILIFLICDILLTFNTAYYEYGQPVNKRSQIIQNYLHSGFTQDTLSVILLLTVGIQQSVQKVNYIPSTQKGKRDWIYICLLGVIFQVRNVYKVLAKFEESFHYSKQTVSIIDLGKLLTFIFFFEHFFSCVWYFVGKLYLENGEINWLLERGISEAPYYEQYLHAFYYASVTMISVGYGDITPTNNGEMLIAILFMFCSSLQMSFSVSSIFNILSTLNQRSSILRAKLRKINIYMQQKKFSPQLQSKIREYLTYFWQEQEKDQIDELSIVNQLSQKLKEDLMIEANSVILKDCQLFSKYFSNDLKKKILKIVKNLTLFPENTVQNQLKEEFLSDQILYFVQNGSILVQCEGNKKQTTAQRNTTLAILEKGDNFGIYQFITGELITNGYSYKSVGFSELKYITRKEFLEVLKDFPDDYEQFAMLKDQLTFADVNKLSIRCFACNSKKHSVRMCHQIHFIPDRELIIKRQNFAKNQNRRKLPFFRKFTQFNALNDLEFLGEVGDAFQGYYEKEIKGLCYLSDEEDDGEKDLEREKDHDQEGTKINLRASTNQKFVISEGSTRKISLNTRTSKSNILQFLGKLHDQKLIQQQKGESESENTSSSKSSSEEEIQFKRLEVIKEEESIVSENKIENSQQNRIRASSLRKRNQLKGNLNFFKVNKPAAGNGFKLKEGLLKKFQRAVTKVKNARNFQSELQSSVNYTREKVFQNEQKWILEKKMSILRGIQERYKEMNQIELLILKVRNEENVNELEKFKQEFESGREFKIYLPQNNWSYVINQSQSVSLEKLFNWMKYMIYPNEFLYKYKLYQNESPQVSKKKINRKSKVRTQSILQKKGSQARRKTKAFQILHHDFQ